MARDGFQLIQEAVANWRSLNGVTGMVVVEEWLGNSFERGFLAKVSIEGQPTEYVELVLVDPVERAEGIEGYDDLDDEVLEEQATRLFDDRLFNGSPRVRWRRESWE